MTHPLLGTLDLEALENQLCETPTLHTLGSEGAKTGAMCSPNTHEEQNNTYGYLALGWEWEEQGILSTKLSVSGRAGSWGAALSALSSARV